MEENFEDLFDYRPPTPDQAVKLDRMREVAKAYARALQEVVPVCADRSAALRLLRQTTFTANAAIIHGG